MELSNFDEFKKTPNKTVLLGNGFSIDWNPKIFTYNSLFDSSIFSNQDIQNLFDQFKTKDFEKVMRNIDNTSEVLKILFKNDIEKINLLKKYYNDIKNILVETISKTHPDNPTKISESEYNNCAKFLTNFVDIYTTNYDLLLYWVKMKKDLDFKDCFWPNDNDTDNIFQFLNPKSKRFMFLHGALHLYSFESNVEKIVWNESSLNGSLKKQIKEKIENNIFPLFVSDGSSIQKLEKIKSNHYLYEVYDSLFNVKNLVTFGFSFSENDEHIYSKFKDMKQIENIIIGIYPKIDENEFKRIENICKALISETKQKLGRENINLYFYDSTTAKVWR